MYSRNTRKLEALQNHLNRENFMKTDVVLPKIKHEDLQKSRFADYAEEVFQKLGGVNFQMPQDLGYHLEYNGLLIQLDDELHFNRYRKQSLESGFYNEHKGFNVNTYRSHCRIFEKECIKAGLSQHNWTSPESERIFGKSEDPGDLSPERNGSSAWKLRTWTDFLQDISGELYGFKVLRISVYDKIMVSGKLKSFGEMMESSGGSNFATIAKSLVRRIINLKGS